MAENKDNNLLQATDFTPLEASRNRQKMSISPGYIILGIAFIFAAVVLVYLFLARSVIFLDELPMNAGGKVDKAELAKRSPEA